MKAIALATAACHRGDQRGVTRNREPRVERRAQELKAKVVMPDGVVVSTEEGGPQGGPLSPLLSNIVLDELDRELGRRGHRFAHHADGCNIYVRSERAGQRVLPDGRVAYRTKYPRRGGRTHLVMEPLQCMARIAALIPPPKFPWFGTGACSRQPRSGERWSCRMPSRQPASTSGIARGTRRKLQRSPNSCRRQHPRASMPAHAERPPTSAPSPEMTPSSTEAATSHTAPVVGSIGLIADVTSRDSRDKFRGRRSTSYIDWATLMTHSLGIDVTSCPRCSSTMKAIAVITEPEVIQKILVHLRLPLRPERLEDGATVVYDVTGEPVLDERWRPAEDAGWGTERGPPGEWDCVDAPAPGE